VFNNKKRLSIFSKAFLINKNMTLRTRRILYITFLLLFFIITPLLCLYAAGYKINFSKGFIQKTGMLVLDSKPEGARIFLNNKPQQFFFKKYYTKFTGQEESSYINTPAKIKNLLPGEYRVRLELEGYWPWEKKLKILPGVTTYAEDINLFKKNTPLIILNKKITNTQISYNKEYIAALNNSDINLIKLDDDEIINKTINNQASSGPVWSWDSKKILLNTLVLNDKLEVEKNLNKIIKNIYNPKWDLNNSNIIYYQNKNGLNKFDLKTSINETLFRENNIIDYLIKDNYVFLIRQIGRTTNLEILKNKKLIKSIKLPFSDAYTFVNPRNKFLNIYDKKYHILYLINKDLFLSPLQEIISGVTISKWVKDDLLLYAREFELWLFDVKHNQKILLTRISQKINNIEWYPSNNYVFYATDYGIYNIELDKREKRNITELIKLENLKNMYLDKDGKNIYFYAKIGNQEGIYKLNIQ